jgi:MFS family permease
MRRLNLLSPILRLPRDLRLLFFSLFLWTFGLGVYNYVWSIYLRSLNANPEQVGLVFSIGAIVAALTMIPGGILANKYELRILLITSWATSIPAPIIFYYAHAWPDVIPGLVLLQIGAFSLPAMNALIGGVGDRNRIASAFAAVYSAAPLGIVLSPAIGSVLLTWLQIRDLFWVSFLFFTISTLILLPVKTHPPLKTDSESPLLELPKSSLEVTILLLLAVATVAFSITSPFLPLYFQDSLALNAAQIQLLGAVQSLGGGIFAILLGKMAGAKSPGSAISTGLLTVSAGLVGIMASRSLFLTVPMVFLFGSARAPSPVAYSILSSIGRGGSRAGRFGLYLTLEQLGFVIGSYLGGLLYGRNPTTMLATSFFIFLFLAALSWAKIRRGTLAREGGWRKGKDSSPNLPPK